MTSERVKFGGYEFPRAKRPCDCDKVTLGSRPIKGECFNCWLFHHVKVKNLEWGGDGRVTPLSQLSQEQMSEYRAARQTELRNRPKCGTHLKRLVSYFATDKGCSSCKGIAADMDRNGPEWCRENIEMIVGHMEEKAFMRGIPFLRVAGRLLVHQAIRNAEAESAALTAGVLT